MKINCIIIEDEPLALKKLEDFIVQVDFLNLVEKFDNALSALGYLKTNDVDLIFLDIRMKELSGIQFLETLRVKPKIIITSAYDEYAIKGYELDVSDYLLKPIAFDRFLKAVNKIHAELSDNVSNKDSCIFVKTEHRLERVALEDILYIQGMKDYLKICTVSKNLMTLNSFRNILQILPKKEFFRVHNSYVVSISKIDIVERNRIKIRETYIPISDSYKDVFFALLNKKEI